MTAVVELFAGNQIRVDVGENRKNCTRRATTGRRNTFSLSDGGNQPSRRVVHALSRRRTSATPTRDKLLATAVCYCLSPDTFTYVTSTE